MFTTDDRNQVTTKAHMIIWVRWANKVLCR